MKLRTLLALVFVIVGAGVCVRLGLWQLSRWEEKRALNGALAAAIAAPAVRVAGEPPPLAAVERRTVEANGRFDESRQILLAARTRDGSPGVEVVTPLLLSGGARAILVNRGWLYAIDAATARPQEYPEPGTRAVRGFVEPLRRGAGGGPIRIIESDSTTLYSARWLDADSLAGRLPYAIAPYVVRQLPGGGVPNRPSRALPRPLNESMHLSYAVQWFLFASILVGGSAALAWSRRRMPELAADRRA